MWHIGVRVIDHSMFDFCFLAFLAKLCMGIVLGLVMESNTWWKIASIARYMNVKAGASLPVSCVFRQPQHACIPLMQLFLG